MRLIKGMLGLAGVYLIAIRPSRRKNWMDPFRSFYYAHRGLYDNARGIPENSMKAFEAALNHGYGIELDVQITKDQVPVIFHDTWMDRMARDERNDRVYGKISDYTLSQLRSFHLLDTEERIPELSELLKLADGKAPVIVELKAEPSSNIERLCRKTDECLSSFASPYIIESFHPMVVLWYRRNRPNVIRGQLSEAFTKEKEYRHLPYLASEYLLMNFLTQPDFVAYNALHEKNLSRRLVRGLFRGPSVAWTIQSSDELERMRRHFDLFIFEAFEPGREPES